MGNLERLDEKMSGENEKGEAECVLEPSAGMSVKVVARGDAVGSTEQESCVEENVVVSQEIEEEKNDNVQHATATATATEEKKPNLDGTDSDEGDKEEMGNAIEDGGFMSVKEEESGLKAENCESLSSAKVDGNNLVVFKFENGEKDLENTKVGKVEPRGNNPEEMPADQDNMENEHPVSLGGISGSIFMDVQSYDGDGSGTEEEQVAFMKELENFHKEMNLEFKPPKFYGEGLNCLKLWRQVIRLGGYEQVTSCKLWRQVGESFNPPKTCTTISWSFRCFYEKALLEYEKHKVRIGELGIPISSFTEPVSVDSQLKNNQSSGSGRTIRDAAARAMQGWHTQRLLGNGEVGDPIIKDKSSFPFLKHDKQLKNPGIFKRKKAPCLEHSPKAARTKVTESQMEMVVVDVGPPADWVKINVRKTKDCFEVYALVPGLLREEVHVQSDPAGRLVISGEPEQLDNPWGVTPFKKIVTLPSRIDPHQTSAVVTLHGQLFVRAPFQQLEL